MENIAFLKLVQSIAKYIESDFVQSVWNEDEIAGAYMILCFILANAEVGNGS